MSINLVIYHIRSSQPLSLLYLGDHRWVTNDSHEVRLPIVNESILIKKGFVTDLASIPRPLYSLFPRDTRYSLAGAVHDYLYNRGLFTRKICDNIFKELLISSMVEPSRANLMYTAVRLFGKKHYRGNQNVDKNTGSPYGANNGGKD